MDQCTTATRMSNIFFRNFIVLEKILQSEVEQMMSFMRALIRLIDYIKPRMYNYVNMFIKNKNVFTFNIA